MTFGDLLMLCIVAVCAVPVGKLFWRSYGARLVSSVSAPAPAEITSSDPPPTPSAASRPRTDAPQDGRTEPEPRAPQPATLDICQDLRAHGYTRDSARAFLKKVGYTLGNDVWAQAAPPPDDTILTPIAGRPTRARYYDDPALEYTAPPEGT